VAHKAISLSTENTKA